MCTEVKKCRTTFLKLTLQGPSSEIFCSVFIMNVFHLNLLLCTIRLFENDFILKEIFSIFVIFAIVVGYVGESWPPASFTMGSRDFAHRLLQRVENRIIFRRLVYSGESRLIVSFTTGSRDSAYHLQLRVTVDSGESIGQTSHVSPTLKRQ